MTVGLCDVDGNKLADLLANHGSEIVSDTSVYWHAMARPPDGSCDGEVHRVTHLLADLGWVDFTVPQSCLGSTAAAVQPNSLWNVPNLSPREDGSPCNSFYIA